MTVTAVTDREHSTHLNGRWKQWNNSIKRFSFWIEDDTYARHTRNMPFCCLSHCPLSTLSFGGCCKAKRQLCAISASDSSHFSHFQCERWNDIRYNSRLCMKYRESRDYWPPWNIIIIWSHTIFHKQHNERDQLHWIQLWSLAHKPRKYRKRSSEEMFLVVCVAVRVHRKHSYFTQMRFYGRYGNRSTHSQCSQFGRRQLEWNHERGANHRQHRRR